MLLQVTEDTHMTSTLRGGGVGVPGLGGAVRQKWDVIGCRGWEVSELSGRPIFIFFIKENWIYAMARHHAELNINILLTRHFPFDSYVR